MNPEPPIQNEQATLWNGSGGHGWVAAQDLLDQTLKPFEHVLVEAVSDMGPVGRVLDVGCGTGSTTRAVARALGPKGCCTGIDISRPMIDAAQARAERENERITFICDDAQTHAFQPQSFDAVLSRFGVMFFDDFTRAFENLRIALRAGGALRLIVWRSPSENPFMTAAERAAGPVFPDLPARRTDAPGQFALADRERVQRILHESGWVEIEIRPLDIRCTFPERDLVRYFTTLGPVGRILQEAEERTRVRAIETIRPAFNPYVHGDSVRFMAACWIITARSPDR